MGPCAQSKESAHVLDEPAQPIHRDWMRAGAQSHPGNPSDLFQPSPGAVGADAGYCPEPDTRQATEDTCEHAKSAAEPGNATDATEQEKQSLPVGLARASGVAGLVSVLHAVERAADTQTPT
jgi:hypothetical protein